MTSDEISPANFFFHLSSGPYWSIPGRYRVLPGLVPNYPSSFSSRLSFSPCPHRVHTTSSEICIAALKYVFLLWNIYCHSEICIATLKYVLLHTNIYFCHSEIYYPDGMHMFEVWVCPTFAGSRRPLTGHQRSTIAQHPAVCPHRVPPSARNLPHGRLSRHHVKLPRSFVTSVFLRTIINVLIYAIRLVLYSILAICKMQISVYQRTWKT